MQISKLKILELASVLAGPSVGSFFSELGCQVIKIENKATKGDITRQWKLATENPDNPISAYYAAINYNKKNLLLDFFNPDDIQQLQDHIKQTDIVILNFKQADYHKFNLTFEALKLLNPKIIYATISGFEDNNPRLAYDLVLQAETGFMHMNGQSNSPPTKFPIAIIDLFAAHQLKQAILVALYEQTFDQKPRQISVSLYESAIASLANQATNYLMQNQIPERQGSLHPNIAPYGEIFQTKDHQSIVLAIGSDKQSNNLFQYLNISDTTLFHNNQARLTNRTLLQQILQTKIKEITTADLQTKLLQKEIPFGIIKNMAQVFENPTAQKMIQTETIEGQQSKRVKTIAFKIAE